MKNNKFLIIGGIIVVGLILLSKKGKAQESSTLADSNGGGGDAPPPDYDRNQLKYPVDPLPLNQPTVIITPSVQVGTPSTGGVQAPVNPVNNTGTGGTAQNGNNAADGSFSKVPDRAFY